MSCTRLSPEYHTKHSRRRAVIARVSDRRNEGEEGPYLRILAGSMEEESGGDSHADLVEIPPRTHQVQLVAVHSRQQLLPHVL